MPKVNLKKKVTFDFGTPNQRIKGPGEAILTEEEMASWFIPGLIEEGSLILINEQTETVVKLNYEDPFQAKRKAEFKPLDYGKKTVPPAAPSISPVPLNYETKENPAPIISTSIPADDKSLPAESAMAPEEKEPKKRRRA